MTSKQSSINPNSAARDANCQGYVGKVAPNMRFPLLDCSFVTSSWDDIPVLHQNPVLNAKNICDDPIHRLRYIDVAMERR